MKLNLLWGIFAVVGVILFAVAFWLGNGVNNFKSTALSAEGTVIELNRHESRHNNKRSITYRPVVRFSIPSGTYTFESSTGGNRPLYSLNQKLSVLYNPRNPHDARINSFLSLWFAPLLCSGLGAIFFLVGSGGWVAMRLSQQRILWFRQNGLPIQADIASVALDTSMKINGRYPWRITAQWQDGTGDIHIFKSDRIWFNPESYLKDRKIEVLVAPGNRNRYWMNTSFLPKSAK